MTWRDAITDFAGLWTCSSYCVHFVTFSPFNVIWSSQKSCFAFFFFTLEPLSSQQWGHSLLPPCLKKKKKSLIFTWLMWVGWFYLKHFVIQLSADWNLTHAKQGNKALNRISATVSPNLRENTVCSEDWQQVGAQRHVRQLAFWRIHCNFLIMLFLLNWQVAVLGAEQTQNQSETST